MYPSGRWRGYWEQDGVGRQTMRDLFLHFDSGKITGKGHDVVGVFVFEGTYDHQGHVTLIKHYLGQHDVAYSGRYDGEGTIYGQWSIGLPWSYGMDFRGPFALFPDEDPDVADAPILEVALPTKPGAL